ncbi:protease [Paenibacillus filicis]|uniref:Protease n=1 Tax=Paenibacillus gyeongsangnamensis TaxID=3388067 RepID=A0ABT4QGJ5_9BACL|nr:protease [Paenibacillus filicis]MCZ8515972.1 protease [Paenibacillus filicis]
MIALYWSLLAVGVLFAVLSVLIGDIIGSALDGAFEFISMDALHWFQPTVLFSGLTVLGGAGVLLTRYSPLPAAAVLALSLLLAAGLGIAMYLLYVKPMRSSENSVAYSMKELAGSIGEVSIPIPAKGYGEVLLRIGGGVTNQIAASFDQRSIAAGLRVVVVEVKDDTLYVSPMDDQDLMRRDENE